MMIQSTLTVFLLIATGRFQVANAQIDNPNFRICGLNYSDVTENCRSNPTCPTGDNCPAGYTCYQLSEQLCPPETPAPTPEPTAAPTPEPTDAPTPPPTPTPLFKVCASGFIEATELCYDTSKTCATCNNVTEACFQIRPELCADPKTATTSPVTAAPTEAPTESVAPTKAPTPNRFFCAESWETVDENCDTLTPCPNGQQDCAGVGNCYQIQAAQCGSSTRPADLSPGGNIINDQTVPKTASPTKAPSADPQTAAPTTAPTTATPTVSPTEAPKPTLSPSSLAPTKAPIPNRFFCSSSWATVDENCATATPCPNGQWDCNGLGVEMNCYQIQAAQCPGLIGQDDTSSPETEGEESGAQLSSPSGSSPQATISGPVRVCAKDIIEATFNCNTSTPCPNGAAASCASGEACFELDSCGTSSSNSMTGDSTEESEATFGSGVPLPSPGGDNTGDSTEESEYTFGVGVPLPSPGGENQVTSPPTSRPSQAAFEFNWGTPSPNGSNIQQISFVFKLFLVGVSVVGAALAM